MIPPQAESGTWRRRPRRSEILLLLASLLVVLAGLEGFFRVRAALAEWKGFTSVLRASRPPRAGARVTLGQMIRPSENPRVVYELWPDMDVVFDTGTGLRSAVRTSSEGFRGRGLEVAREGRLFRIAGIGDSLMFGWGVEQEAGYLAVLEKRLNREHSGLSWEVLNTAVPGYNAAMELETLETKVLKYRPDLVVYGFCPNDASLPNFIRPAGDPLSLRESFLWGFLRGRFRPEPDTDDALVVAPRRGDDRAFEDDPARVPERYRGITGWDAYRRALEELRDLGREHDFRTIVLAFVPGTEDPRKERGLRIAAELGLPIVDVGKTQAAYMRSQGIVEYAGSALTMSGTDLHPSPLSHELAAADLLKEMAEQGLVPPARPTAPAPTAPAPTAPAPTAPAP
jgi:GDSL-like Lipase/Acylhydrolase family